MWVREELGIAVHGDVEDPDLESGSRVADASGWIRERSARHTLEKARQQRSSLLFFSETAGRRPQTETFFDDGERIFQFVNQGRRLAQKLGCFVGIVPKDLVMLFNHLFLNFWVSADGV